MLNFLGTVGGGSDVVGNNDGNSCSNDDLQHGVVMIEKLLTLCLALS
jgi:hypothetical protein